MRKLFLAFALLLTGAAPAFAFDTPKALLEALYAPYSKGESFDWSTWDESQFRSKHLNELFAKDEKEANGDIGRLDFDPYIDGQDYQISKLTIGEAKIEGDTATVEVTFNNFDLGEDLTFTLVREADGWKIDDVTSANKDFPYSLKAIMEGPLDTGTD
ncbi:MAG TPA: DUF3828 domain-containing protein [Devosia sp.]|nr:DUF3828 domain-containing protein [Devosia sp.]